MSDLPAPEGCTCEEITSIVRVAVVEALEAERPHIRQIVREELDRSTLTVGVG